MLKASVFLLEVDLKIYKDKLGAERDLDASQKDDFYVPDSKYFKACQ